MLTHLVKVLYMFLCFDASEPFSVLILHYNLNDPIDFLHH